MRRTRVKEPEMTFDELVKQYEAAGYGPEAAVEEAAREVRLTTGDIYFGRSAEEIEEMKADEAAMYEEARWGAGICDEFPAGEFAAAAIEYFGYGDEAW